MTASLRGKRIAITRPAAQAQSFIGSLQSSGAVPILFPTIQIVPISDNAPLDSALKHLSRYDWIVFTSVNGVNSVLDRVTALEMKVASLNSASIAGIGPATAAALRSRGVQVDLQPRDYVAEAIFAELNEREVIDGNHFLLLRADIARAALREQLTAAGGIVEEIPVYQTVRGEPDPSAFAELQRGVDVITFTSSSTVRYFFDLLPDAREIASRARIVCIGPITAQTARDFGLNVAAVAESYTVDGLLIALLEH